jgi:activator of 2-hydroxyglutaryl-CoA dehydratase
MAPPKHALVFTGGVPDRHPMIVEMFAERWAEVRTPAHPQFMAAHGCVLLSERDTAPAPEPPAEPDASPSCEGCHV